MGRRKNEWNEDFEATVASTLLIGLLKGVLKYGMYLTFPLHVAMVVVGIIHRDDCPINKRIPWYLIFGGAAGIMTVFLRVLMIAAWSCIRSKNQGVKYDPNNHPALAMVRAVTYLFRLFVVAWNITATFHIYSVVPNFEAVGTPEYCHETTYMLTYVLVILFDVFSVTIFVIWVGSLVAGVIFPEMVENLYEDDEDDDNDLESIASSLPDIELEEDANSMREKQRQRRRKRKQKRKKKLSSESKSPKIVLPSEWMIRRQLSEDISAEEEKNMLSSVRFSRMVDSRRISKDYYSQLQQQDTLTPNSSVPRRLKDLFSANMGEVKEEVA